MILRWNFFLQDLSFVVLLLLPWSVSEKFTEIGPQQAIIALVGEEAIFPCHLLPQMDVQDMDVMWFYGESSLLVHQYKDRKDYLNHQHQEYKGRTEFLQDDISRGSVALKLHHIRPSDEGKYRCLFESSGAYGEAEYQVYVAGKGSVPHISITSDGNKSLRLVCTSTGWYPEPEIHWRMNQEMLLSEDTTIQKKENGLFSIETSITVSTKSIVNISCLIWNPLLRQKLEASVSVSDDLFPHNTPRIVIWIVNGILITVILILIFVIWKLTKVKAWASRRLERGKKINIQEWPNPGYIPKEQRGIEPSSLFHHEEVQERDQKEMEGNLSPSSDTLKKPVVNKEEPVVNEDATDINNDRCAWAGRPLERREWNGMQKEHKPGNMQKKQKIIKPFTFSHHEKGNQKKMEGNLSPSPDTLKRPELQKGDQKKMEGNLSPSPDTLKKPDLQTAQKYRVDVTLDVDRVGPFLLSQIYAKGFLPSSHKTSTRSLGARRPCSFFWTRRDALQDDATGRYR